MTSSVLSTIRANVPCQTSVLPPIAFSYGETIGTIHRLLLDCNRKVFEKSRRSVEWVGIHTIPPLRQKKGLTTAHEAHEALETDPSHGNSVPHPFAGLLAKGWEATDLESYASCSPALAPEKRRKDGARKIIGSPCPPGSLPFQSAASLFPPACPVPGAAHRRR